MTAPIWAAPASLAQPPATVTTQAPRPLNPVSLADPLRPIPETHTMPPYPAESVRAKEDGVLLLGIHITSEGAVDDCKVLRSTGYARLDDASCDHVKRVWRWQPPTIQGRPTGVNSRVQLFWDLRNPDGAVAFDGLRPIAATHTVPPYPPISVRLDEEGTSMLEVHITTQGSVDDCRIVSSSNSDRLDIQACDYVKRTWRWQPPTAGGLPIQISTRIAIRWSLLDAPETDFALPLPIVSTNTMPLFPSDEWGKKPAKLKDPAITLMRVHVTAEGGADSCAIAQSSGSALLDQTACEQVKRLWRWHAARAGGQSTEGTALASIVWDGTKEEAAPFHITGGSLLTSCASQDRDVRQQMCDAPLEIMFSAVLASSLKPDAPALCGLPQSTVQETDLAAFRTKVLGWIRTHPEVAQQDPLSIGRDNGQAIFVCKSETRPAEPGKSIRR
jgi:TonB family protein